MGKSKAKNNKKILILTAIIIMILAAVIFFVVTNYGIESLISTEDKLSEEVANTMTANSTKEKADNKIAKPKAVGGNRFFTTLKTDGTVWGWGENAYGQLGLGDNIGRAAPSQINMKNVIDIATGGDFTLLVKTDGTVWASGFNKYGQLGDGSTVNSNTFHKVKLNDKGEYLANIVAVTAENYTAHALTANGDVYSWGNNNSGQFGIGASSEINPYPVKMTTISNITQIVAGNEYISMLHEDGSVWSVGSNTNGQFGCNHNYTAYNPQQMKTADGAEGLYGVKEIAAGFSHTVILKEDGTVWGTGINDFGQLMTGNQRETKLIVQAYNENREVITNAEHITASGKSTYISRKKAEDGSTQGMYVAGRNNAGQLFTKDTTNSFLGKPVETDKEILTMALTKNNEYYTTGLIVDQYGMVYTVGDNQYGAMGKGTAGSSIIPYCISSKKINVNNARIDLQDTGETKQITCNISINFNLLQDSLPESEYTFTSLDEKIATVDKNTGMVTAGEIGTTNIKIRNEKYDIEGTVKVNVNGTGNIAQAKVVAGNNHFISLKTNGEVWGWGDGSKGQLGNEAFGGTSKPVRMKQKIVTPDGETKIQDMNNVIDIAAGETFTLVLKSDGTVWSTGYNYYGQLGNGNTDNQNVLTQVKGAEGNGTLENIVSIGAGYNTAHAITGDGEVYSWGNNSSGQFGNNTSSKENLYPTKTPEITNIIQISGGNDHTAMLDVNGSVWGTGYNYYGQLGLNNNNSRRIPQQMLTPDGTQVLYGVKEVAAAKDYTLIMKKDGSVWGTGYNIAGQLMTGSIGELKLIRQAIDENGNVITDAKHISAANNATYISRRQAEDGSNQGMYVAGSNSYGNLFTLDTKTTTKGRIVQTDKDVLIMAMTKSAQTGAIVDKDGMVYTVGYNGYGEMGNGINESLTTPWCISNLKISTTKEEINYQNIGDSGEKIIPSMTLEFNLLKDKIEEETFQYISVDNEIASVTAEGIVTAEGMGSTFIRIHNEKYNTWGSVKVNVRQSGNIAEPKVVAGNNHFIALKANGEVWSWGAGGNGQLGNGTFVSTSKPVRMKQQIITPEGKSKIQDMTDAIDVASGTSFSLVLKADGTVWSTGNNYYGQLGNGDTQSQNVLVQVKGVEGNEILKDVVSIAAGDNTSYAITKEREVYSWGSNMSGQFGNNTSNKGSIYPVKIPKVSNIIQVSAGANYTVMLDTNGSVWVVGDNYYGQLGLNDDDSRRTAQQMLAPDGRQILYGVKEIAVGTQHTMILKEDGTVWGTGYGGNGELMIGTKGSVKLIRQAKDENGDMITDAKHISAANDVTYVSRQKAKDGSNQGMYVGGYNKYGNLFTLNGESQVLGKIVQADKNIITMALSGNVQTGQTGAIVDENGMVYTAGYNGYGEMGNETTETSAIPSCISKVKLTAKPSIITYKEVGDTGEKITYQASSEFNLLYTTLAQGECEFKSLDEEIARVDTNGIVTATGLGNTTISIHDTLHDCYASVRVQVNGEQGKVAPKIVSGGNHFVALKSNGEVWNWGYNGYGQLGNGDTTTRTKPTKTNLYDAKDTTQEVYAIDVAAGAYHTMVLKSDGTVWTSGYNGYGQLGNGDTTNTQEFVKVIGITDKIIAISANNNTSYALTEEGNVYSWGYNGYGQFGNNDRNSGPGATPVKMQKVSNIIQISAGENYAVLLDANGSVWSVGDNRNGQLGTNNTTAYILPQQMLTPDGAGVLNKIKKVEAGINHTILLTEDETAYAVGYNGYGQLGNGNKTQKQLPVQMIDNKGNAVNHIKDISANGYTSIISVKSNTIVDENGEEITSAGMYVAGYNNNGQLWTNDGTDRNVLTKIQTDKNIITMASTKNISYQTSVIADDLGLVYAVGYNQNGEMGDDSTTTTAEPASISNAKLKVNQSKITLNLETVNQTSKLEAGTDMGFNLLFDQVVNETIMYKSLDETIATVTDEGVVTGLTYGTTYIEVSTNKLPDKVLVEVQVIRKHDVTMPKIVNGQNFSVALQSDGSVWTWGYNYYGQLGLGDKTNRYKPTKINIKDVVEITAGENHVLLVTKEGKVYSFGQNSYGQLGRTGNEAIAEEIGGLENIIKVAAGCYHSMALAADGSVYTWGYNGKGQLGNGTTVSNNKPSKIHLKNVYQIEAANQTSTAIDGNGNLYVWGNNEKGQLGNNTINNIYLPKQVVSLTNVIQVAAEDNSLFALTNKGEVLASGYNGYGNLGNNQATDTKEFVKVIEKIETTTIGIGADAITTQTPIYLTKVKTLEAGNQHIVAIKEDGTAVAWGNNSYFQMSNGTNKHALLPTPVIYGEGKETITDILDISAGENSITIARNDGKVWSIGRNNLGQLGDGSTNDQKEYVCISKPVLKFDETPIKINGIGKQKQVKASMLQGFNLLYSNIEDAEFSYQIRNKEIATVNEITGVITSVKKGKTQLAVTDRRSNQTTSADIYVLGEEDITYPQVESSNYATVTLKANGEVWSYGYNGYGQLGTKDTINKTLPTYTGINNIMQVALGNEHSIAVDKEGHVWTWGYNSYGQLGIGTTGGSSLEKVQVKSPDGTGYLENIIQVAAGDSYSVALDNAGNVYTWGYNQYGQLGLGDSNFKALPVQVEGLENIIKIEAANRSVFAIDGNNKLYAAGYNQYGNLGDGTTGNKSNFVEVKTLENVADVSAGPENSTIVLLLDGTVWGFGNQGNHALTNIGGAIPQQLQGPNGAMQNITAIGTGYQTGYAITSEEKVIAWGLNNYSQLASGDTTTKAVPIYMKDKEGNEITDIMTISGGVYNTEIVKNDGTVWSIGYNGYGELGDGSTISQNNLVCISSKYIQIPEREITLKLNNPTKQLIPEVKYGFNLLYDHTEDPKFTYQTGDETVATIEQGTGTITGMGLGRTYITITSKEATDETRVIVNVIREDKKVEEKVSSGHIHSIALKQDGTIWGFGDNSEGEMGNGTISMGKTIEPTQIKKGIYTEVKEETTPDGSTQTTTTQIEVELNNIIDIAAGYYFNLVVDSDGYVYSFGYNGYGNLGNNDTKSLAIPTRIEGLTNIKKVYTNKNTAMAINESGEIYVWGYGYEKKPTKINLTAKAVDINGTLILTEDGGVWKLAKNPSKISGLNSIVEIASGDDFYAALNTKGEVYVWGYNGYGQLSQGNTTNVSTPTLVKIQKEEAVGYDILKDIIEIKAGNKQLQMISKTGELYATGYNANGELGIGNNQTSITMATKVKHMDNIKFVETGSYHSIASDKSGFVYATGYNTSGQLGNGSFASRNEYGVIGDTYVHVNNNRVTLEEGKTLELKASLDNKFNLITDTIDDQNILYSSLNEDIATIGPDGILTAKQTGTVEIIAKHSITNKTATVFVQVVPEEKVTVPKIEIGDTHMAALKADGTVWTWGANSNGQLGTGNNNTKTSPTKVDVTNIIDISVGYYNTAMVKADGTVWTFGYNRYNTLGDGTSSDRNSPVQVIRADGEPLTKIAKVVAGTYETLALDEEGNVWVWGYYHTATATKLESLENIIDISPSYAVKQTGEVITIKNPNTTLPISDVIRVSEGANHTFFLTKEGKAYGLGDNSKGQLGIGTTTYADIPTLVQNAEGTQELENIKEIKAGKEVSIAVLKNGDTYTWGSNENYKLGSSQQTNQVLPKKNEKVNVTMFADAGSNNGAIIDKEGFVYTWGAGDNGILGNRLNNSTSTPELVGKEEVGLNENDIYIQLGETHQVIVANKTFNVLKEVEDKGEMDYQVGNNEIATIDNTGLVTGMKEGKTTIVVNKVGTQSTSIANITVLPKEVNIEPMALTCMSHTTILKSNGTVWSYGVNTSYELGNGTTVTSDQPIQVKFPEGVIIKQIAIGNTHNLALDTQGNVWGWGVNANYALAGYTAKTPTRLGLSGIKKVVANNDQSMAITEDGYVYVWGYNANGELGVGTYQNVKKPTLLTYINQVLDISLGRNHTIILTTRGEVYTTGLNVYGQTMSPEGKTNTFQKVEVPVTIGKIAAGDNHSVLLSVTGDIYTFGYNASGQLGNGTKDNIKMPIRVNAPKAMQIAAGKAQTIILGEDRKLYATGANNNGELGIGTTEDKLLFTEITTVNDMMTISSGNTYQVSINYDGNVYGWGDYYHGTSSIKTKTNSRIPMKIGNDSSYAEEPEITVKVNKTKQVKITPKYSFNVLVEDNQQSDFTYESINTQIATVNETGMVAGIKTGITWVKVTEKTTLQENIVIVKVVEEGAKYAPQVAGGDGYAAVLKADGSIWSFGYNSDGQLGNDQLAPINVPSQTNILATYKQVIAGEKFTLALREDGTVWAWGDNTYGTLGQGNRVSAKKPVQVQALTNITSIAAGDNHGLALDSLGNVYSWGLNASGQLGNGNHNTVSIPEKINSIGNQVVSIAAGENLSAFTDSTGTVYVFGDNSKEQIQSFKYDYDNTGEKVIPAKNLTITEPTKLKMIQNAVKVDNLATGFVILKTDGSVVKTNGYAAEETAQIETISLNQNVDLSATNESIMLLDKDGYVYTYGDNTKGQAGIGEISERVELQKVNMIEGKTYLSVGTGYKNNYMIDTEGFVFAAGENTYGQLGNGTYNDSLVFTLSGERKFEIIPETKLMKQPEEETVTIKANIFNLLNHNERKLTDYEWQSDKPEVVSVENGVLIAQDMGTATITATDKATGEQATALRVVQPVDEQRINLLSVNDILAEVSGENKYEVSVSKNSDGTGTLKITTEEPTDQISIDNGTSYVTGTLTQDIVLDTNPKIVNIKVRLTNGRTVDYTLTINILSQDASLSELMVNNINATPISSTEYEIILSDTVTKPEVHVVANSEKASVSVDASIQEKKETTKTIDMTIPMKKTVPIQITAENGDKVTYILTIYKENALTKLDNIMVDGKEAIKLSGNNYKAIVPSDQTEAEITASSLYPKSKIEINQLGEELSITTKIISTIANESIVEIFVRAGEGINETETVYTLTIVKEGTEDLQGLLAVTVNGVEIKPVGKVYDAYIGDMTNTVEVKAMTINDKDIVQIGENEAKVHISTVTISSQEVITTYMITVTDSEDSTIQKQYTLNIKKPSTDNSLLSITVGNEEFSETALKQEGTNIYQVSISEQYNKVQVIALANYEQAEVSINGESFEKRVSKREITIDKAESTKINILVKALNGDQEAYTLEIRRKTNNTNLKTVTIDGEKASVSKTEENTYEYTLDKIVDKVTIGAITEDSSTWVGINTTKQEKGATYREVQITGREIVAYLSVTADDGTSKEYKLIIHALPDNVNLSSIKINGKEAEAIPINKYQARVNQADTSFELYVIPDDPKAKVQIDENTELIGTASATITKNVEEIQVNIKVTAQDGTEQTYQLIVSNQSDDNQLAILKVDNEILLPDENGDYQIDKKFLTEEIEVQAIANSSQAVVSINDTTPTQEIQTSTVTMPDETNTVCIVVTAEDGTSKKYILTINKLSNETGLTAFIEIEEDGVTVEREVTINQEGKGIAKIGKQEMIKMRVVAKDKLATVSIQTELPQKEEMTKEVVTTEEQTNIPIQIIAQDGTIGNYEIVLAKSSTNNQLASLEAEDIETSDIMKTSDNSYLIKIPDTIDTLKLTATAEDEFATVKIENGDYSTDSNVQTQVISITEKITEVSVLVKAENGDEKEYQVTIQKVTDLGLASVKIDGQECILEDGNYLGFIDKGTTEVGLSIIPNNPIALISTKTQADTEFSEPIAQDTHIRQVPITENETIVLVQVEDPDDASRTRQYAIIIADKSSNSDVQIVQVEGKDAIKLEDGYHVSTNMEAIESEIFVKADHKYSTIKIASEKEEQGESKKRITLASGKITTLVVTITAQDGTINTFNVFIERKSQDTSCEILINDTTIDETDIEANTYTKYIERNVEKVNMKVTTTSELATIEMEGEITTHIATKTISTTNERTKVDVTVTAESGEKVTYIVYLVKKSTDNLISNIKVNGKTIEENAEGNYVVKIKDTEAEGQKAEIEVTANEPHAQVQIGDGTQWDIGVATSIVSFAAESRTIELNINIQAQDGSTQKLTKKLILQLVTDDVSIKTVKNGDNLVMQYDSETHTFTEFLDKEVTEVNLAIEANDAQTKLSSGTTEGVGVIAINNVEVLSQQEVIVTFIATAETGRTQEYIIKLLRKSDNANATNIYVDGVDILNSFEDVESVPTCVISIGKNKNYSLIEVIPENKYASIKIGDFEASVENSKVKVPLDTNLGTITVPLVITSQDGKVSKTYNIMFVRLSNDTKIQWLEVNGKHVIEDEKGNYKVTVKASEKNANVKITLSNILANITMGGEIKQGQLEENVILPNTGDVIKTITITAIDGTVRECTLTIHKHTNDLSLDKVYLNNRLARKVNDTTYEIDVQKGTTLAEIKAITTDAEKSISINENTITKSQNTYSDCSLVGGSVKIKVMAMYEEVIEQEKEYQLIIKEVEEPNVVEDLQATIKIDGEEILPDAEGNYTKLVENKKDNVALWAGITSETSKVKIKDKNGETPYEKTSSQKNVSLQEAITQVEVIVQNGGLEEKTYTIKIYKLSAITGKIITQAIDLSNQSAKVLVYSSSDKRDEQDKNDPREIVQEVDIQPDGTYQLELVPGEYDIVVKKTSYLTYRLTNIVTEYGEAVTIEDIHIYAGDVVETGEIEIDDLVTITDHYGQVPLETEQKYDLNEDGVVDKKDRALVKTNYTKQNVSEVWVNPKAVNQISIKTSQRTKEKVTTKSKVNFVLPIKGNYTITSPYGTRIHPITGMTKKHTGIDLSGTQHTEILAIIEGEVTFAGVQNGFGNCVEIKHIVNGETIYSFYAHLSKIDVQKGEIVKQAQTIGLEGGDPKTDPNSGNSTGHHLHFEIRKASGYGNDVDPNTYIEF